MNIGILTFHRSHNYGALLQAIALRRVLEELGQEASYVDYYPEYDESLYTLYNYWKLRNKRTLRKKLGFFYHVFKEGSIVPRWIRIRNFKKFRAKYLEPYFLAQDTKYDMIVYGSDQLWRKQPQIKEYDPIYFGKNDFYAKKHVSYAVSMAQVPTEKEDKELFNSLVRYQDKISVRESQMRDYLIENGFKDVTICVDPTLLLDSKSWDSIIPSKRIIKEKYILVYDMQGKMNIRLFQPQQIEKISQLFQCRLVYLRNEATGMPSSYDWQTASPDDFLNLIRYAECVLTSSFHAAVFSIVYNKQFYASQVYGAARMHSLLSQLGISNHMLERDEELTGFQQIDYSQVSKLLADVKKTSIQYLKEICK